MEKRCTGIGYSYFEVEGREIEMWKREFAYGFMALPYEIRCRILDKFNLIRAEEKETQHIILLPKFVERIKETNCAKALFREIQKAEKV